MMTGESVQAFIPAYNEEATIKTVLERTYEVLERNCANFEVLAYDDASTDGTGAIMDEFARTHRNGRVVHRERNGGWGTMTKYAYLNCAQDWITIVDSDMQFDPYDLEKFFPFLKDYDVVISGRLDRKDGAMRKFITRMDKLLLRLLFSVSLYDLHWIKFVKTRFLERATITGDSPFVETEILIRAKRNGARIKEFWLPHYPRLHGEAKGASLKNVYTSLKEMLSLYMKLRKTAGA